MANFQPAALIEYDGRLLNGNALLYDTTQGVRIWGDSSLDNYSIGDTTTGGVDATYGNNNLAIGKNVLQVVNSGKTYNIGIGSGSLAALTTGDFNLGIGYNTLGSLLIGEENIAIGTEALSSLTTASSTQSSYNFNVAVGYRAAKSVVNSKECVYIGSKVAFYGNTASDLVSIRNFFIGNDTGKDTSFGPLTDVGSYNTIIGSNASLSKNGVENATIIGMNSSGASQAVAIGPNSGIPLSSTPLAGAGEGTITIGLAAGLFSTDVQDCIYIGNQTTSGQIFSSTTPRVNDIFIGAYAGSATITGSSNILIGANTGNNLTSGSNNIIIGQSVNAQSPNGSNNIDILTNAGTKGIQYTNSTGILSLKSTKANIEGRLSVGSSTSTSTANIAMLGTISGAATAYAVFDNAEIQTDVTATAYNYYSQPKIVASHPGLTRLDHFTAVQGTLNNTTVTNQYGFFVGNTLVDGVNNTGFYGNLPLNTKTVNTMSQTGTTVTAVTTIAHTLKVGSVVSIMGCSDSSFDISRAVVTGISTTTVLNDTFTFTVSTTRTVGSTVVTGALTDLSDLNLEMLGTAPNIINGYILAGRQLAYFDSMQVGDPGGSQISPNNQFVNGIASISNSTNLTFGASISLFKNNSSTPTDMTATPTGMNIGHIYWGTTDGRKYINAASINVRTTAATNPANAGGSGGATTNMVFNVANNSMPDEVGRFTPLGLKVLATQINTGTQANTAWLATGTANSTTFLRGDGTWATVTGTSVTPSIARTFALMGA